MTKANKKIVSTLMVLTLVGGIIASVVLLWIPRLQEQKLVPMPPSSFWSMAEEDGLTASTPEFTINVHEVVASPNHITVVYSTSVSGEDSGEKEATISNRATLVGSDGTVHRAQHLQKLASDDGETLASISFEAYELGSTELTLHIEEIQIDSVVVSLSQAIDMHILNRLRPQESTNSIARLQGIGSSDTNTITKGPYGSFLGSAPQGQVATVSYTVGETNKYFLIKPQGIIQEISEQQMASIKGYLGITG